MNYICRNICIVMKHFLVILMIMTAISLSACGDKAAEIFDTAKLEELQHNPEHAGKLYQEIIEKYPDSQYAEKAKERLAALKKNN